MFLFGHRDMVFFLHLGNSRQGTGGVRDEEDMEERECCERGWTFPEG